MRMELVLMEFKNYFWTFHIFLEVKKKLSEELIKTIAAAFSAVCALCKQRVIAGILRKAMSGVSLIVIIIYERKSSLTTRNFF